MHKRKLIRVIYNIVVIVLLLCGLGYVLSRFVHLGNKEWTDNAQVQRHITQINTRVQGYIKEIRFSEYQPVHKGDTLLLIEDAEYRLQLAQAEANLAAAQSGKRQTEASVQTSQSNIGVAEAGIDEARAQMENARREYERYAALLQKGAVTQQQFDAKQTAYETARDRFARAQRQRQTTTAVRNEQSTRLSQNAANIELAKASADLARLNLSYTVVTATCDGVMGRKGIHEGQLVQPGQTLATIVDADDVWVIANYRETQLRHIHVGDAVEITADAVPGVTFKGKVETLSGATGAAVSVVPQDNATGNFVKVEQRVPVRIALEGERADLQRLIAGLNVECNVIYKE